MWIISICCAFGRPCDRPLQLYLLVTVLLQVIASTPASTLRLPATSAALCAGSATAAETRPPVAATSASFRSEQPPTHSRASPLAQPARCPRAGRPPPRAVSGPRARSASRRGCSCPSVPASRCRRAGSGCPAWSGSSAAPSSAGARRRHSAPTRNPQRRAPRAARRAAAGRALPAHCEGRGREGSTLIERMGGR